MKIRSRLALQFILLTASIFTLALFFIYERFEHHVENEFFALLESKARMTAEMILRHERDLRPLALAPADQTLPITENTAIFDDSLRCVFSINPQAVAIQKAVLLEVQKRGDARLSLPKTKVFGASVLSGSGRRYVVISEDTLDRSKLYHLRNILLLTFVIVMAAVAAGGWFYSGQALLPFSRILGEVDRILPADLSRRLKGGNQHDEVSHLTDTFNRLLDRIEDTFRTQRGFISNVSHELKNPLAAMSAQLQWARQQCTSSEAYERVLVSLQEDIHNLSAITEKLLHLAKVHSESENVVFSDIRLDELLYQTRDGLLKTNPNYTVRIEIRELPDDEALACIRGNEALLRLALLNLFDNGCKYSPDRTVCASIFFDRDMRPYVEVRNSGEGIPKSDLPHIFKPFYRSLNHNKLKGSGIGLSLVYSILKLHYIETQVESSPGKGVCFRLVFPNRDMNAVPSRLPVLSDYRSSIYQNEHEKT